MQTNSIWLSTILDMKKSLGISLASLLCVSSFSLSSIHSVEASTAIAGSKCSVKGSEKYVAGAKYTCLKRGKSLAWSKGVSIVAPTSFSNLYERRSAVSYTAWRKISAKVNESQAPNLSLDSYVGPNTNRWYNNLPKVMKLVSSAFKNFEAPKQTLAISYNFDDLNWATELLKTKISPQEYAELDRSEGGQLLSSNCREKDCVGSKQVTTQGGLAILLFGVPNSMNLSDPVGDMRFREGQLEAHEFFHAYQRVQLLGKPMTRENYPPIWLTEGSAEWVQNAVMNYGSFDKYMRFIKSDCQSDCRGLSESELSRFMSTQLSAASDTDFNPWLNYPVGSLIAESLVAVSGHELLLQVQGELSKGIGWVAAFKNVYKEDWAKAYPEIAKTIAANLRK